MKKARRAKRRQVKLHQNGSESSDVDGDGPSSSISKKSRSTTPASSQPQLQFRTLSCPSSPVIVSMQQNTHSCTGQSHLPSLDGSQINPSSCESDGGMIPATSEDPRCSTDPHF